jgi:hypothetical protein
MRVRALWMLELTRAGAEAHNTLNRTKRKNTASWG